MNLQVISAPDGEILWVSGPLPGAVHDLTAARIWGILAELAAAGLVVLADNGYAGAGDHVRTPYRGRGKPASQKEPTVPTPSYALPGNAPTPSSRPGASCANSAAAPGAPDSSPKPSTSFKPAKSEDEKRSLVRDHPARAAAELGAEQTNDRAAIKPGWEEFAGPFCTCACGARATVPVQAGARA
jgi:hypothetical protein